MLLEYFPAAAKATNQNGSVPLHFACHNKSTTRGIVQLLIDAAPVTLRSVNNRGDMPLHCLCRNKCIKETAAIEIAELLMVKHPEAVRHADNDDHLPIHIAAGKLKSPDFCRLLIEAYPGSERIADARGALPLHHACGRGPVATVEYFYELYPDAINHATTNNGLYPIHYVFAGLHKLADPEAEVVIETVQYLLELDCDPNVKLQKFRGRSLLHYACRCKYDLNIKAALEVVKTIFDAYPEAINEIACDMQHCHEQVQAFINSERVYARQAKDRSLMNTPDDNGQLPLHTALLDNVRLGSIKLLVKGNPSAIRSFDDKGVIPLHIACQHHDSASVVGYMISLANITLDTADRQGNTALHYACRGAKYETISMLLDKFDAVSVSKRNAQKKLPIDLLWESNAVEDRQSIEYTENVFRLLKAYPETVMNVGREDHYGCLSNLE